MREPAPEVSLDRRHRVVLWALAISRPQPLTIDQIAEALWPRTQPATRDKVVQGSISVLRKTFGRQAVETTPAGYRLAPDVVTVCDDFERHVSRAHRLLELGQADRAAAVLTDTLESWAGPAYAALSHWAPAEAEQGRLTELTLQAEELLVESLLQAGRVSDGLPLARSQAASEPLRETRWLALARAAYLSGNQSAALDALRDCRRTLRHELGVDPSVQLDQLETAVLRHDPALSVTPTATASRSCPWPGLRAYDQGDAESFFGRDAEISRALRTLDTAGSLVVAGPSGIGKSSFVRAGLSSALTDAGLLVQVSTPLLGVPDAPVDVLVLDQAEELFSLPHEVADEMLRQPRHRRLVLAIRTDGLARAASLPRLANLVENSLFLLGPISAEGLREAVERPAEQEGLLLEPGLVELLLRDVAGASVLPLFSHAMAETWQRREGRTLTIEGYLKAGGVQGALSQSAEELYESLDGPERLQLRSLLLRLVAIDEDGSTTRRRVTRQQVPGMNGLIERLVTSRLVTSDGDTLSLTHDALTTAWPRLQQWLADDVEGRRQLQHLAQVAQAWEVMGRPDTELYRGPRLVRALAWADSTSLQLADTERAFLDASHAAEVAQRAKDAAALQRERRTSRRLRILAAGLAGATVLAITSGAVAVDRQHRSDTAARRSAAAATEADANRVGAVALNTDDAQLSLLLAAAAQQLAPGPATNRTLSAALAARPELIATGLTGGAASNTPVTQLASSGARVFALDARNTLTVLTPSLVPLGTIDLESAPASRSPARTLAAGPRLVAAAAGRPGEASIELIDPLTQRPVPARLEGLPREGVTVASLSFSSNGQALGALLVHDNSRTVMVWSLPDGKLLGRPIPAGDSTLVRLSDDAQMALTNDPLAAHHVPSGAPVWVIEPGSASTLDAHGSLVAVPTPDRTGVQQLDLGTGRARGSLTGIDGTVLDVSFSPNGGSLAGTTSAGITYVWDLPSGQITHRLETGSTAAIAFSSTGDTLFTGGGLPGSLLAWDLQGRRSFLARTARDGFGPITDGTLSLNADATWLAMSSSLGDRPQLTLGSVTEGPIRVMHPRDPWRGVGTWGAGAGATRYYYADGSGYLNVLDTRSSAPAFTARISTRPLHRLAPADVNTVVALDDDNGLLVIDARTLTVRTRIALQQRAVTLSAGKRLVAVLHHGPPNSSAGSTSWQVLDLNTGRVVARGVAPIQDATVAALSTDGSHLALGNDLGALAVVALPAGSLVAGDKPGSALTSTSVIWSPTGAQLVFSAGLTLKLWDAHRGGPIAQVRLPAMERGATAAFSPDGGITVATREGNIYRWDASARAAAKFACQVAGRELTPAEWRDAFGDRRYRRTCP